MKQLRVLDQLKQAGRKRKLDDDFLVWIHHRLMKEYGWIPLEDLVGSRHKISIRVWKWKFEFQFETEPRLTIPMVLNLLAVIEEQQKMEEAEYNKAEAKGKMGRGRR